jgi:hypothetical protein
MEPLARTLMLLGLVLLIAGALVYLAPSIPLLGRLPGDIRIERAGFRLYLPLTSCILLSLALSALLALFSRLR